MSNEEARIQLFNINAETKNIRRKMKKTLETVGVGDLEQAMSVFGEAEEALDNIKKEYVKLKQSNCADEMLKEQEGFMGFTEIVRDTVKQAAMMHGRCGGVRFHVYS